MHLVITAKNAAKAHPARDLFPTICGLDWRNMFRRHKWTRNDVALQIRARLSEHKLKLLRKDGL